jgi:hypothetical protein
MPHVGVMLRASVLVKLVWKLGFHWMYFSMN